MIDMSGEEKRSRLVLFPAYASGVQYGDVVTDEGRVIGTVTHNPRKGWRAVAGQQAVRDHLGQLIYVPTAEEAAELVEGGYRS